MLTVIMIGILCVGRTEDGLVQDRLSNPAIVSIAATGFDFLAQARSGQGVSSRIRKTLDLIECHNPPGNRGWVSHFLDREGRPLAWSEVSTIDTAILYEGALKAALLLGDVELARDIAGRKSRIDTTWLCRDGYLRHGFWNRGGEIDFIECLWDSNSEGVILYRAFGLSFRPRFVDYGLPLFTYAYPLCFYDDVSLRDDLRRAVACQKIRYGRIGITACDGPDGYQVGRSDVISPLLLEAIRPLVPEVEDTLRMLPVPRDTPAYCPETGWRATDRLGIDEGSAAILLDRFGTEGNR